MKNLWIIIIIFSVCVCNSYKQEEVSLHIGNTFDSLKTIYETSFNEEELIEKLYERYEQTGNDSRFDSLNLLHIPILEVPANKVNKKVSSIDDLLVKGELSYHKNNWIIFRDKEKILAVFSNKKRLDPIYTSNDGISLQIEKLISADHYFKIMLVAPGVRAPISGIMYFSDNEYRVLSMYGADIPIKEIYTLSEEKEMDYYNSINNSVEMLKKLYK